MIRPEISLAIFVIYGQMIDSIPIYITIQLKEAENCVVCLFFLDGKRKIGEKTMKKQRLCIYLFNNRRHQVTVYTFYQICLLINLLFFFPFYIFDTLWNHNRRVLNINGACSIIWKILQMIVKIGFDFGAQ